MAEAKGGAWPLNDGSVKGQKFWLEHGEHLTAIGNAIGEAFKAKDGGTLLMMDAALRALVINIAEGLRQQGVKIETE